MTESRVNFLDQASLKIRAATTGKFSLPLKDWPRSLVRHRAGNLKRDVVIADFDLFYRKTFTIGRTILQFTLAQGSLKGEHGEHNDENGISRRRGRTPQR